MGDLEKESEVRVGFLTVIVFLRYSLVSSRIRTPSLNSANFQPKIPLILGSLATFLSNTSPERNLCRRPRLVSRRSTIAETILTRFLVVGSGQWVDTKLNPGSAWAKGKLNSTQTPNVPSPRRATPNGN